MGSDHALALAVSDRLEDYSLHFLAVVGIFDQVFGQFRLFFGPFFGRVSLLRFLNIANDFDDRPLRRLRLWNRLFGRICRLWRRGRRLRFGLLHILIVDGRRRLWRLRRLWGLWSAHQRRSAERQHEHKSYSQGWLKGRHWLILVRVAVRIVCHFLKWSC